MQGEPSRWSPGGAGAVTQAEGCQPDSEELAFILSLKAGKAASPVGREAIRRGPLLLERSVVCSAQASNSLDKAHLLRKATC